MKLTNVYFASTINGYEFIFTRNEDTKVWTFSDYNATIAATNIDKAIETMQSVIKICKILNKSTTNNVVEVIAELTEGDAA